MSTNRPPSPGSDYATILRNAERHRWRIEELIGPGLSLDFARPFLPEALAGVEELEFLAPPERLRLNQIRGRGYLHALGMFEQFILPFVLERLRPMPASDVARTRALLDFASEEAKHIQLFARFTAEFDRGFVTRCEGFGPPESVAAFVLARPPLAVALIALHVEWMTQRHYQESVVDDGELDPQFKRLLKFHWLEEAQHAQLDALMLEELAGAACAAERAAAVRGYLEICEHLSVLLRCQAELDLAALERAVQRVLPDDQARRTIERQHLALRRTFLATGMGHPRFLAGVERLGPEARAEVERASRLHG